MVGEVWGTAEDTAPYLKGLPSMFNFDFYHGIKKMVSEEKNSGIIQELIDSRTLFKNSNSVYIDAIFINNHDQNRLLSIVNSNVQKGKLAAAILLTLPGMPYIYYGDEIGMLGQKPDEEIREPFLWDVSGNSDAQTSWIAGKNSNDSTVVPLAVQILDESSIYNWYKALINFRNQHTAIRMGQLEPVEKGTSVLAYTSSIKNEHFLMVHNLTSTESHIDFSEYYGLEMQLTSNSRVEINAGMIILPAYSSIVLSFE